VLNDSGFFIHKKRPKNGVPDNYQIAIFLKFIFHKTILWLTLESTELKDICVE